MVTGDWMKLHTTKSQFFTWPWTTPVPGPMGLHLLLDSWFFTCPCTHSSPGFTDSHMSRTLIYIRDIIIVYLLSCCCALVTSITHLPVPERVIPPLWFLLRFFIFFVCLFFLTRFKDQGAEGVTPVQAVNPSEANFSLMILRSTNYFFFWQFAH